MQIHQRKQEHTNNERACAYVCVCVFGDEREEMMSVLVIERDRQSEKPQQRRNIPIRERRKEHRLIAGDTLTQILYLDCQFV